MAPSNPISNIHIAASDGNTSAVLAFLRADPTAANARDSNGYTPIHAAASYGHLEILRLLVSPQYGGNINITDADGDTPLFTCEAVEMARVLVEELGADSKIRNDEGLQAADVIEEDGQYPLLVTYLRSLDPPTSSATVPNTIPDPGSPPPGVSVDVIAVEESAVSMPPVIDEEFRRRIEELASRQGDLSNPQAQQELRSLVTDAVQRHVFDQDGEEDRNVRSRQ